MALIWKEEISHLIQPLPLEGNNRIQAILCSLPTPLCVVNCYLPSGTSQVAKNLFSEDIDILYEIMQKYKHSHEILIMGDLNEDHTNRNSCKERQMKSFIEENDMVDLSRDNPKLTSYNNQHLGHYSKIDYFLVKKLFTNIEWEEEKMAIDDNGLNSSYHTPILTSLNLDVTILKGRKKRKNVKKRIYRREEMETEVYQNTLDSLIADIKVDLIPTDAAVKALQIAMNTAVRQATPYKEIRMGSTRTKKWTPLLAEAIKTSKIKHHLWKEAGRPGKGDPLFEGKKRASKAVRTVQRRQEALDRKKLLQDISEATENNQA